MVSRSVVFLSILLLFSLIGFAQKPDEFKQPRILVLLDGSSSMVNEWASGKNRFSAAGDVVLRLMDSIYQVNDAVEFSLRVYGHQHGAIEKNCFDTRREVMFSKSNRTQMSLRLSSLHPIGVSPIAYSLKEAAEMDFVSEWDYAYSLVLITDGGESCDGNICNVVKELLEKKIQFRPYIISLVDYAPLKEQYNCLGTYLTVSKPAEVAPAIHTITEAYRKVLRVPIAKPKRLETASIPAPSVQKIHVPEVKVPAPEPETTRTITPPPPKAEPVQAKTVDAATPAVKPEVKPVAAPSVSKIKVDASMFPKDQLSAITALGYDRVSYTLFWSTPKLKKRPAPVISMLPREAEPAPPIPAPPPPQPKPQPAPRSGSITPATPIKPDAKEAPVTVKVEPASETLLEIYFTDGKGKFYHTTPPMQLVDAKTGREVKKFYRTVDGSGNPDPQKVPPGNYVLVMGKAGNVRTKAIAIQPANRNKVTVVVSNGTLLFRYQDNPKRPVREFTAKVRKTFESRTSIEQRADEELEYEPGNYHIELNTTPAMVRNIDLDFGWAYTIEIPEPGFVQFTGSGPIGRISLWAPLGDQFLKFLAIDVTANSGLQRLQLQPGVYEIHWKKNPNHPLEPDVVQKFYVKSNETTTVELK